MAIKRLVLDTNAYVAFKQNQAEVVELIQYTDMIGIPVVVLGELLSGFALGSNLKRNKKELDGFLSSSRVMLLPLTDETASFYAEIYRVLRKKGRPIPTNDMWIAAIALQHGYAVCSFDQHFNYLEALKVGTCVSDFYP